MGFPARHRCADFNGAVASATIFHRHPSWGNPGQGVACVGDLWTRDRATQFGSSNGSERILAVRTAHGWLSIRDGPAARDPGAHNDLTVGRHWYSSASWLLVGWRPACWFCTQHEHGSELGPRVDADVLAVAGAPICCCESRVAGIAGAGGWGGRRVPELERRDWPVSVASEKGTGLSRVQAFDPLHPACGCGGLDRLRSVLR